MTKPMKLLRVVQTTLRPDYNYVVTPAMDPSYTWVDYPYVFDLELIVQSQAHSDPSAQFYYTAEHIKVGDWLATTVGGIAVQIKEIIELVDPGLIRVKVEDVDCYNIFADPFQSGYGCGPDGDGFIFEVAENGLPLAGPVIPGIFPGTFQADLEARFFYVGDFKFGGGSDTIGVPTDTNINDGAIKGWVSGTTTLTDALDQVNYLLERALPARPADVGTHRIEFKGSDVPTTGVRLAQGTIPNNVPNTTFNYADPVVAIDSVNAESEIMTGLGLASMGTLALTLNGAAAGSIVMTNASEVGVYDKLEVLRDYDFPAGNSSFAAFDAKIKSVVPDGINEFKLSHSVTGTSTAHVVVETMMDDPIISATTLTVDEENIVYSSGVPHYTVDTKLSYNMTVDKVVGRTFPSEKIMGLRFEQPIATSDINYDTTGMPDILSINHGPITMNDNEVVLSQLGMAVQTILSYYAQSSFKTTVQPVATPLLYLEGEGPFVMETPPADSLFQPNIKRVALGDGDRPAVALVNWITDWNSGSAGDLGDLALWEAPVIGGIAKNFRGNLNTFLPTGPDFRTKPTTQFISFKVKTITNRLKLDINGTYSAVYVKLPGITQLTPNAVEGWWDGTKQADHAPLNWPGHANAGDGCLLSKQGSIVEFTFGNISSANATDNIILVRFALGTNDEIRSIRIAE